MSSKTGNSSLSSLFNFRRVSGSLSKKYTHEVNRLVCGSKPATTTSLACATSHASEGGGELLGISMLK